MKINIVTVALLSTVTAYAEMDYIVIQERCTQDNLGPEEARMRNAWAKKCFPDLREDIDAYLRKSPIKYALGHNNKTNSDKAPLDINAPCDNWRVVAFCTASCYTADQRVRFLDGYTPIQQALEQRKKQVLGLREDSTTQRFGFTPLQVGSYSQSFQAGEETIRHIETRQGYTLDVTLGHPMLLASGKMVTAEHLQIGQKLMRADGRADEVIRLTDRQLVGKVYNVAPMSSHPVNNILDAQGLLVGSSKYQNMEEFTKLMNRKVLRKLVQLPTADMES